MKNPLRKNNQQHKDKRSLETIELTSENAMIQERSLDIEFHHT